MKFDLTSVEMSRNDLRRGLRLPDALTEELAEDIGIMVGDGHIGIHKVPGSVNYQICVSGNAVSDYEYLSGYVWHLKKELYNLEFPLHLTGKLKTEIRLQIFSKGLVDFYTRQIGLPLGKKTSIRVPKAILQGTENIKRAFLRGFAETDGGLTFRWQKRGGFYPRLKMISSSRKLIEDVTVLLADLGFVYSVCYDVHTTHSKTGLEQISHEVWLNGRKSIERWLEQIGFRNPKNKEKIERWRKIIAGPEGFEPST